jgi:hypothetical protein
MLLELDAVPALIGFQTAMGVDQTVWKLKMAMTVWKPKTAMMFLRPFARSLAVERIGQQYVARLPVEDQLVLFSLFSLGVVCVVVVVPVVVGHAVVAWPDAHAKSFLVVENLSSVAYRGYLFAHLLD